MLSAFGISVSNDVTADNGLYAKTVESGTCRGRFSELFEIASSRVYYQRDNIGKSQKFLPRSVYTMKDSPVGSPIVGSVTTSESCCCMFLP
jgi:hypothetical protein